MEGTAFIARGAAKTRRGIAAGQSGHSPGGAQIQFRGDINAALKPTLEELEIRLAWRPQRQLPLLDRITKIGTGLLSLKEIEFLGEPHNGTVPERQLSVSSTTCSSRSSRSGSRATPTIPSSAA